MGLFKKKSDPFAERERDLNKEIARIEEELRKLNRHNPADNPDSPAPPSQSATASPNPQPPLPTPQPTPKHHEPPHTEKSPPASRHQRPEPPSPKIRSTSRPGEPTVPSPSTPPTPATLPRPGKSSGAEPIFEDVNPFRTPAEAPREPAVDIGIRRDTLSSNWQRLKNHFRGPVTSNPKLVNYLAAGSIQGLRPLRYERRVARNRFIVLVAILVLILWGILALLIHR